MERRFLPDLNVVNLYDILPPQFKAATTANDTSALYENRGKYMYQGVKKLTAAANFDFDYALWLDSEAIVVQPFRMRDVFDEYVKQPVVFTSRMAGQSEQAVFRAVFQVLGRSHESYGPNYFNIERYATERITFVNER
jgi:hypothetical protein